MGWELETVEKPFVDQLTMMGWRYVEGDLDAPAAAVAPDWSDLASSPGPSGSGW